MRKFLRSFYFAARGIALCVKTERNMRVHLCAAFYVLIFMPFYGFSSAQKALIFVTIGSVISAEAFNTAVEAAVDLCSPKKHPLAGLAKDAAAGAVLVTAIAAAAVGTVLYFDKEIITEIFSFLAHNPLQAVAVVISLVIWGVIITRPSGRKSIGNTDNSDNNNEEK